MSWQVRVLSLGMLSSPADFETKEEADKFAADMRRIPGMIPIVEEAEGDAT